MPAVDGHAHASPAGQFGSQGRLAVREKAITHTYKWMWVSGPFHMLDIVAYKYVFITACWQFPLRVDTCISFLLSLSLIAFQEQRANHGVSGKGQSSREDSPS